ncbi:MAG: 1-acyl-sn-glycerol-3-phosphate acyltransferase [Proteobacteria bacterium]|nr:1-acyl-sn-glycerol-3-phosphate acyltransferase [Pseudomonadota bacterium]
MRLWWALRSLAFVLFMVLTVVPWATAIVLLSPFAGRTTLYWACVGWVRLAIWGCRAICGVHARVQGMAHVLDAARAGSALLLASKHQSIWEAFALPTLMPRPLAYVFKRELLHIPFFGWAMSRLDMIHIDRSRRTEAWHRVAEQGRRLFGQGVWVIMFPEGTRTPRGSQGVYKLGASRLAVAIGVPIVPIAVASGRCWPRRSFLLRPGVVDVVIGAPIAAAGRDAGQVMREVEAWIETEMRRIDPEAYAPHDGPAPAPAPR